MIIDLTGKTALVTGSTGGIGLAIATRLAASGASVIVNGRKQPQVDAACAKISAAAAKGEVRGVVADVGTIAGCESVARAEPVVDILVNNAGIFKPLDFFSIPDAQWEEMLGTNVLAGMRLARAYLPGMAQRDWGRVIFISSESALNLPVEMIDYGVTKTAILGLSRALAKRMAGGNVTVNTVLPGPTLSEGVAKMLQGMSDGDEPVEQAATDFVRTQRPSSILQRMTTPEEIANLVAYVASPLSSATTGAALRADGGVVDTIA